MSKKITAAEKPEKEPEAEKPFWTGKTIGQKLIMSVKKVVVNGRGLNEVTDICGTTFLLSDSDLETIK